MDIALLAARFSTGTVPETATVVRAKREKMEENFIVRDVKLRRFGKETGVGCNTGDIP
jgi:hypothetical protein